MFLQELSGIDLHPEQQGHDLHVLEDAFDCIRRALSQVNIEGLGQDAHIFVAEDADSRREGVPILTLLDDSVAHCRFENGTHGIDGNVVEEERQKRFVELSR